MHFEANKRKDYPPPGTHWYPNGCRTGNTMKKDNGILLLGNKLARHPKFRIAFSIPLFPHLWLVWVWVRLCCSGFMDLVATGPGRMEPIPLNWTQTYGTSPRLAESDQQNWTFRIRPAKPSQFCGLVVLVLLDISLFTKDRISVVLACRRSY